MLSLQITPKPFDEGYLPESYGHKVWYAQYGNKDGPTIISLHGGPGSKSKPHHAARFDLDTYHVVTFDQRGCGKSKPTGKLEHNTTDELIEDIERLRSQLEIDTWFVSGGSWGSTLALAYAQAHPDKVRGLLLSSIYLARKKDTDWAFYEATGVSRLFPDLYEHFQSFLKSNEISPNSQAEQLLELVQNAGGKKQKAIVAQIMSWENNLMSAQAETSLVDPDEVTDEDIASVKIFLHYDSHNCFLADDQLVDNMSKVAHLPAVLVHGRHDILCPLDELWELQKKFKDVRCVILPTSNHDLTADGKVAQRLAYDAFLFEQA